MDTEADFFRLHVGPHLKQWGDYSRVENAAESGTPDISYAINGVQGWIETKLIRDGKLHFEKFQLPWLKKRLRHAHGNLWVIATDWQGLYVYSATQVLKAKSEQYRKWRVIRTVDLEQPLVFGNKPFPWGDVLVLLTQHTLKFTPTKIKSTVDLTRGEENDW